MSILGKLTPIGEMEEFEDLEENPRETDEDEDEVLLAITFEGNEQELFYLSRTTAEWTADMITKLLITEKCDSFDLMITDAPENNPNIRWSDKTTKGFIRITPKIRSIRIVDPQELSS